MTMPPAGRAGLSVVGSVAMFGLLVERAGLIPAIVAAVVIASRGSRETSVLEALVFGTALAAGIGLLFVGLLGQPFVLLGAR